MQRTPLNRFRMVAVAWFPTLAIGLRAYAPFADRGIVLCSFRRLTGFPCPGCGMTRALTLLVSGDWESSLRVHPLVFVVAGLLALMWVYGLGVAFRGWRVPYRAIVALGVPLTALFVVVWAIRLVGFAQAGTIPVEFRF